MEQQVQEAKTQQERNELLWWGAARGLLADVADLLSQGADHRARDKRGLTAAHFAASKGHLDVVEFLAAKGADLEVEDAKGRTPLHHAALGGALEAAGYLAKRSAWLDSPDGADDAPLHLACRQGHAGVVRVLLDAGASTAALNKRGLTPLGEALAGGHVEAARQLVQAGGADLAARCGGYSLLHLAAGFGQAGSLAWLLQQGADPGFAAGSDGATPLHAAALAGSVECARALLAAGADASQEDAEGRLPEEVVPTGAAAAEQVQQLKDELHAAAKGRRVPAAGSAHAAATSAARSSAGPHAQSAPTSGAGAGAQQRQEFARLTPEQQERRVMALSRLTASELQEMDSVSPAARAALAEVPVRRSRELLACLEAVAALQSDDSFREAAGDPAVAAALDAARQTGTLPEGLQHDPSLLSVLGKMRKLQAVLRENGGARVSVQDVLLPPDARGGVQETRRRAAELRQALAHWQGRARTELGGGASNSESAAPVQPSVAASGPGPVAAPSGGCGEIEVAEQQPPPRPHGGSGTPAWEGGEAPHPAHTSWEEWMEQEMALPWQVRLRKSFAESSQRAAVSLLMMGVVYALMWACGLLPGQDLMEAPSGGDGGGGGALGVSGRPRGEL